MPQLFDPLTPSNYPKYGARGLPVDPATHWRPKVPAYRDTDLAPTVAPRPVQPTYAQYYGGRMPSMGGQQQPNYQPRMLNPQEYAKGFGAGPEKPFRQSAMPLQPDQQSQFQMTPGGIPMDQWQQMMMQGRRGRYNNPLAGHPAFQFGGLGLIGSGQIGSNGLSPQMMEQMLGMGFNYRPQYPTY